jgi:multidrug efflux system membrane fusion protein
MRKAMLLSVCCLLGVAAVAGSGGAAFQQGGGQPQVTVKVAKPVVREVIDFDDFTGRVEPSAKVNLHARVTGYVTKIAFQDGAMVQRGQVLFEIDPRPYEAQLDAAKATLAASEAALKAAKATSDRYQALAKQAPGSVSIAEVDQARAQVDQATANVLKARAKLEAAQLNLQWTKVTSPINGRIGRALVTVGSLAVADSTMLATVVANESMFVVFQVDEASHLRLAALARDKKDSPFTVRIRLTGDAGWDRTGKIDFINNEVDPATQTVLWRATIADKDHNLLPGQFARVKLLSGPPHKALLVWQGAVSRLKDGKEDGKPVVYVVNNKNVVEQRAVKLGQVQEDGLQVVEGLSPEDRVILRPGKAASPGAVVDVELTNMPVKTTPTK